MRESTIVAVWFPQGRHFPTRPRSFNGHRLQFKLKAVLNLRRDNKAEHLSTACVGFFFQESHLSFRTTRGNSLITDPTDSIN